MYTDMTTKVNYDVFYFRFMFSLIYDANID